MVFLVCGCECHHTGHVCGRNCQPGRGREPSLLPGGIVTPRAREGHGDCRVLGVSAGRATFSATTACHAACAKSIRGGLRVIDTLVDCV